MEPTNELEYEHENYRLEIILKDDILTFYLNSKLTDKMWKGIFTHDQLPKPLDTIPSIQDIFPLF